MKAVVRFVVNVIHAQASNMAPRNWSVSSLGILRKIYHNESNMRRRALFIGINYVGSANELHGCINDVAGACAHMKALGYTDNITLADDGTSLPPTKANILQYLAWLVGGAVAGDKLYLHYSGHGSYMADASNDESDRRDETICPLDFETAGFIIDDTLREVLVDKVPAGVQLFCVFDSCHSGTVLDLAYSYVNKRARLVVTKDKQYADSAGDVIELSGCMDNQTSADAFVDGKSQGAMTWALLGAWGKNPVLLCDLLANVTERLTRSHYQQRPQLTSGRLLTPRAVLEL